MNNLDILNSILDTETVAALTRAYARATDEGDANSGTILAAALIMAGSQDPSTTTAISVTASLSKNPARDGLVNLASAIHAFKQSEFISPTIHNLLSEAVDAAGYLLKQAVVDINTKNHSEDNK